MNEDTTSTELLEEDIGALVGTSQEPPTEPPPEKKEGEGQNGEQK
jgi:hypothetical protein